MSSTTYFWWWFGKVCYRSTLNASKSKRSSSGRQDFSEQPLEISFQRRRGARLDAAPASHHGPWPGGSSLARTLPVPGSPDPPPSCFATVGGIAGQGQGRVPIARDKRLPSRTSKRGKASRAVLGLQHAASVKPSSSPRRLRRSSAWGGSESARGNAPESSNGCGSARGCH